MVQLRSHDRQWERHFWLDTQVSMCLYATVETRKTVRDPGIALGRCTCPPLGWGWVSWCHCGSWNTTVRPCSLTRLSTSTSTPAPRRCWPVPAAGLSLPAGTETGAETPGLPRGARPSLCRLPVQPEHRQHTHLCSIHGSTGSPMEEGKLNRNVIFTVVNSAPICCPTSSPLTPMFQENGDSLSDKFLLCPHERGEEQLRARCRAAVCGDDHSFGFRAAGPRGGPLSYPVEQGHQSVPTPELQACHF